MKLKEFIDNIDQKKKKKIFKKIIYTYTNYINININPKIFFQINAKKQLKK